MKEGQRQGKGGALLQARMGNVSPGLPCSDPNQSEILFRLALQETGLPSGFSRLLSAPAAGPDRGPTAGWIFTLCWAPAARFHPQLQRLWHRGDRGAMAPGVAAGSLAPGLLRCHPLHPLLAARCRSRD